jgi:3-deoxy-D-manno-octulosonate 8-phosphate phosphatase (KDO 8-P phosphatase)
VQALQKSLGHLPSERLAAVDGLILDIDGVLADGGITYTAGGDEIKTFHVRDGSGIKYWRRAGHPVAFLTGRESPLVERRAAELGVDCVIQGAKTKLPHLETICERFGLRPWACAYMGDDLPDLPVLRAVGLPVAVADAVAEVRDAAAAVTGNRGGRGAVREVIEAILRARGEWDGILARYRPADGERNGA